MARDQVMRLAATTPSPSARKDTRIYLLGETLAALTFAPAFAHLAEMPNKMGLDGPAWYATQWIYRGWGAFLGPLEAVTLIVTAWLLWRSRDLRPALTLTGIALGCYIAMQACFWALNFPVNTAVAHWKASALPLDWTNYRARWEWGHAIRAGLAFAALLCLLRATLILAERRAPSSQ